MAEQTDTAGSSDTTSQGRIQSFPLPQHVHPSGEGIRAPSVKSCGAIGGDPRRTEKRIGPAGGLVRFTDPGKGRPAHHLWIMPDASDKRERTFVLEELGNDSVGVRITTDSAVAPSFRAIIILDGTRCQKVDGVDAVGRIPRGGTAIEELKPGLVDPDERQVWGLIEGSLSSYVISVP